MAKLNLEKIMKMELEVKDKTVLAGVRVQNMRDYAENQGYKQSDCIPRNGKPLWYIYSHNKLGQNSDLQIPALEEAPDYYLRVREFLQEIRAVHNHLYQDNLTELQILDDIIEGDTQN